MIILLFKIDHIILDINNINPLNNPHPKKIIIYDFKKITTK